MSSTLFSLYTADLEKKLERGQAGGVVIGNVKIWLLAYADDIVLLAKSPEEMKEMMRRMKRYLEKRDLVLNTNKSKLMVFKKERGTKKKEKWKWGDKEIEEKKSFKYLGYHFQKNGSTEKHIEDAAKKTKIALKQTWGIGQRTLRNNSMREE